MEKWNYPIEEESKWVKFDEIQITIYIYREVSVCMTLFPICFALFLTESFLSKIADWTMFSLRNTEKKIS